MWGNSYADKAYWKGVVRMTDELVTEMEKWHNILKICIVLQCMAVIAQIILILHNCKVI